VVLDRSAMLPVGTCLIEARAFRLGAFGCRQGLIVGPEAVEGLAHIVAVGAAEHELADVGAGRVGLENPGYDTVALSLPAPAG
jgi:hypothetical protein